MSDFFLSYAHEDLESASKLAKLLQANGASVWWDRSLIAGDRFGQVIDEELSKAKAVIVLWSNHSVKSDWVQGEALTAREMNKLVPVKIEECRLPIPYRAFHTPEINKGSDELYDLARLLSEKYGAQAAAGAASPASPASFTITKASADRYFLDVKSQWAGLREEGRRFQQMPFDQRFKQAFSWTTWRRWWATFPLLIVAYVVIGVAYTALSPRDTNSDSDPVAGVIGLVALSVGYFAYRWYRRSRSAQSPK
jgi:hypothetical protein